MPFLLTPEEFAKRLLKLSLRKKSYVTIPWQMGVLSKVLRIIPNCLFDKILASRKRNQEKPQHRTNKMALLAPFLSSLKVFPFAVLQNLSEGLL